MASQQAQQRPPSALKATAKQTLSPTQRFSSSQPLPFSSSSQQTFSSSSVDTPTGYNHWPVEQTGFRPVDFKPNGSFKTLKETGKLVDRDGTLFPQYKGREKLESESAHYIPGYTGFVRGSQHISGRTFGETSHRCLTTDYTELLTCSALPSSPQENRKIPQTNKQDSFINNLFGDRESFIPGYTGFVPGLKHDVGLTYGNATTKELSMLTTQGLRQEKEGEQEGFARTAHARKKLQIDSAPLPGKSETSKPPEMFIPNYLQRLKYMSV